MHSTPAVILFTSGTEGEPKGVALSPCNLLSNVEQVRAHLDLYETDILFNPLPTFHCFGLTVGSLMPLLLGIKVVCHPTPLAAEGDRASASARPARPSCCRPTLSFRNMRAPASRAI